MEFVRIGHIINTFGLRGELKVFVMTDFRKDRFHSKKKLSLLNEKTGERFEVTVKSYRDQGQIIILTTEEINDISIAENYKNWFIEINKEDAPLPKGMVRLEDLKLCQVFDESNNLLGVVKDIQMYAPTPNMKIEKADGKFFYVPYIDVFVKKVDLENKTIIISPIEGML